MTILGISGSLRKDSYNTRLIEAARILAPPGTEIIPYSLNDLPLFNEDLETPADPPAIVRWKEAVLNADALLVATPEYNSSIPGVLKNAIDWASRRLGDHKPLLDKPVAIVGASPGRLGTALAQKHLHQVLSHIGAQVLNRPALYVSNARAEWEPETGVPSSALSERIEKQLKALVEWARVLQQLK